MHIYRSSVAVVLTVGILSMGVLPSCGNNSKNESSANSTTIDEVFAKDDPKALLSYKVQLVTVDPGHFHAALVQKTMYSDISPLVYVYAPPGPDLELHQNRIQGFNSRPNNPTFWTQRVYQGVTFLRKC